MIDEPWIASLCNTIQIGSFTMDGHNNGIKKLHFLVFPWLAQGHINPFLQLSKALAIHGHKVSFLSTPLNISRIRPSLQLQHWPGQIDLLELPLPPTEGLTPGAECTADIPPEMAFPLKKAMDGMEKPFRSLFEKLSPDYLVHDFVQYWVQSAAADMNVPAIHFSIFPPASAAHFAHPSKLRNHDITAEEVAAPPLGFPSSAITFKLYEARDLLVMYTGLPGHIPPAYRFVKCLEGCMAVIVKSCFEYEDNYISYFQDAIGVPVLSVGPLLPAVHPGTTANSSDRSDLLEWLDRQRAASVVFVSFGSEAFLSEDQIHQLALGLEASGIPFLWCLRFPRYSDSGQDDPVRILPEGFEIRTQDRGLVVQGWVPQVQILSHPSIGGFLSHAGWSSVMESLSFGIPLILLPLRLDHPSIGGFLSHAGWSSVMESLSFGIPLILLPLRLDQGLNARQVAAELEAGIEIERGNDGSFMRESISTTVKKAMAGEEGKKLRSNAAKARDIIAANKQSSYIHDFLQKLEQSAEAYQKKKSL